MYYLRKSKIPIKERKYIAYFQSFTNTYGDEAYLMDLFKRVLDYPEDDNILETVKYLAGLNPTLFGIKLQLLHVLKGTPLAEMYEQKPFRIYELDEYYEKIYFCAIAMLDMHLRWN